MNATSRTLVKNLIVAATLGLAAVASWALTDYRAPLIEASLVASQPG